MKRKTYSIKRMSETLLRCYHILGSFLWINEERGFNPDAPQENTTMERINSIIKYNGK